MEPYNRFLSSFTTIGGYEKGEDGEFLATGGPPYILLTPESYDSYRKINVVRGIGHRVEVILIGCVI